MKSLLALIQIEYVMLSTIQMTRAINHLGAGLSGVITLGSDLQCTMSEKVM